MEEWVPKWLHWLWFNLCKLFLKVNTPQLDLPPTTWFGKAPTQSPATQYRSEATLATPLDCWAICSSEQGNPQSTCLTWKKFWNLFGLFSGKCRVVRGHPFYVDASSFVCFKHIQKSFCIQYVRCIILDMFVGAHSHKCKWIHHFHSFSSVSCKYQCIQCRRHTLLGKDLVPYSLKVIALDAIPELLQVPWALWELMVSGHLP